MLFPIAAEWFPQDERREWRRPFRSCPRRGLRPIPSSDRRDSIPSVQRRIRLERRILFLDMRRPVGRISGRWRDA